MHYKCKTSSVVTYLLWIDAWWRKQALYVAVTQTNLEVLAIVVIMKKRFLQAEEVFHMPYAFQPTSASVNYRDDADWETTGSDSGFQGLEL